jgi:hypothetical protein
MTSYRGGVSRSLRQLVWLLPALLLLPGCEGLGEAMTSHTDVVASAAGKELRVDESAEFLAANQQIPPDPEVVRALADLWVDYALLANAVTEDSTLAALDLEAMVQPIREQAMISQLRAQVLVADTVFDDAEIAEKWTSEGPGAEVSARHILLRTPTDATQAQKDSVKALAESLRSRAVAGESFEALATANSQDLGSAQNGGDLGFFGHGAMVEPFEQAAFALQPGQISPVVETPFGYHVIKVDDRRQQDIADQKEPFRQYLVQQSLQNAEVAYLDSLSAAADVKVAEGGIEVVREIAKNSNRELRSRQADRAVAEYTGGELTAGEFQKFILTQSPQVQTAFASATDEQIESGIQQLVQMELLLAEANRRGIKLTAEEDEQIRTEARATIRELVEATGFLEAARQKADPAALDEHVKQLVKGVVNGEQPYIPLGPLGVILRDIYSYEVNEAAFPQVVSKLEEIRASMPQQPADQGQMPVMPDGTTPQGIPVDPNAQPAPPTTTPPAGTTP